MFIYSSFDNNREAFVITSATVGHGLHCVSGGGLSKTFDEFNGNFFQGIRCVIGNRWLDFGGHPDHGADTEIFKRNFYRDRNYLTFGTD